MATESTPLTNTPTLTTSKESNSFMNKLPPQLVDSVQDAVRNTQESVGAALASVGQVSDQARSFAVDVISSEPLQKATVLTRGKVGALQKSVEQGYVPLRMLAQFSGVALVLSAVVGGIGHLFQLHMLSVLLEVYTFMLGCLMIVLETSVAEWEGLSNVLPAVLDQAKFLKYVYGRGVLYFVAGSLHLEGAGTVDVIIGLAVMLVGVAYIFFGYQAGRKILESSPTAEQIEEKFKAVTAASGKETVNVDEFHDLLVNELKVDTMGRHEAEAAFASMDGDLDGEVSYKDFQTWWDEKKSALAGVSLSV